MKRCTKCGEWKDEGEFHKDKKNKYGLDYQCKECKKIYGKKYREEHKEEIAERKKIYGKENKDKKSKRNKKWRENNTEYYNNYCGENKNYYQNWREKHPKYHSNYEKERKKKDPEFKLLSTLRKRTLTAINKQSGKKSHKTMKLIGCTIPEVRQHLSAQFIEGMSWENHGLHGWHIDHIIPCASFDLTDPEQQKQCFHYTNLQPLWAEDNLKKGARLCIQ